MCADVEDFCFDHSVVRTRSIQMDLAKYEGKEKRME